LVVTPEGKLDRRSQRWLERQQEYRTSLPPAAESWGVDDSTPVILPDTHGDIGNARYQRDGVDTRAQRALTPFMPNAAVEVAAQNKATEPPLIIAGGTLTPLPRVTPTPPALRITLMKRVMITLLALAFLISSAQIAAHNPALAQEGWQALANAVAFTQQQQANAIRTTGVAAQVQAFTQGKRVDLYNSQAQFNQWWGSACSAAVLAEVLTAYGVQNATIGSMIASAATIKPMPMKTLIIPRSRLGSARFSRLRRMREPRSSRSGSGAVGSVPVLRRSDRDHPRARHRLGLTSAGRCRADRGAWQP
jgi:hypothetical protein